MIIGNLKDLKNCQNTVLSDIQLHTKSLLKSGSKIFEQKTALKNFQKKSYNCSYDFAQTLTLSMITSC